MTPVEEDIVVTSRRIKELARVRCSSGKHAGKHAQRIRTKLCSATLRLQTQLRRIRRDSAGFESDSRAHLCVSTQSARHRSPAAGRSMAERGGIAS